jgi:endonuclease/exonuclease/phosphatase family metal-dependent hydrolase
MTRLTVMSFNIAIGGDAVDITRVAAAVEAAGADIVGVQETCGNLPLIASLVGWPHYDEPRQIMSRLPIAAVDGDAVLVLVEPGRSLAVANVHLPAYPYGPHLLRDGRSIDEVVDVEKSTRLADLHRRLPAWSRLVSAGVPLVVTGDFNAPSHMDWGASATAHRTAVVPWPVTVAMESAGFTDTYRSANPGRPGISWTYGFPHPRVAAHELTDRIDFVWASPGAAVIESGLAGPDGVPDVEFPIDPWPSDHLGVVTTLDVDLSTPPPFVAPSRNMIERGERIDVRFHAPGGASDRIEVVAEGAGAPAMWLPPMEVAHFGIVYFGSGPLDPGRYAVHLVTGDGIAASSDLWVTAPGATARIEAARQGADVVVAWHGARPMTWGWIGVYPAGEADLHDGSVAQARTLGAVDGEHRFGDLPDQPLVVRLFVSGTLEVVAEAEVAAG